MKSALVLASLALVLTSCASSEDHTAERALAKCQAVAYAALDSSAPKSGFYGSSSQVEQLDSGKRRVSGSVTFGTGPARNYTCELTPDTTDPRGFRVTRLAVSSSTDPTPRVVADYEHPSSPAPHADQCSLPPEQRSGGWFG